MPGTIKMKSGPQALRNSATSAASKSRRRGRFAAPDAPDASPAAHRRTGRRRSISAVSRLVRTVTPSNLGRSAPAFAAASAAAAIIAPPPEVWTVMKAGCNGSNDPKHRRRARCWDIVQLHIKENRQPQIGDLAIAGNAVGEKELQTDLKPPDMPRDFLCPSQSLIGAEVSRAQNTGLCFGIFRCPFAFRSRRIPCGGLVEGIAPMPHGATPPSRPACWERRRRCQDHDTRRRRSGWWHVLRKRESAHHGPRYPP